MVETPGPRREELRLDNKVKKVYFFVDEEKGIDQKCREVFKKKKEIIHFPMGFDGGPKYKTVTRFVFKGYDGNSSLPVGIVKSANYGYGFTKVLAPLMDVIEAQLTIKEIHIIKSGKVNLTGTTLTLTEQILQDLHPIFKNINDQQKEDRLALASTQLNGLFPEKIKAKDKRYIPDSVNSVLNTWSQVIDEFSPKDKDAIKDLFDKLSLTEGFFTTESLLKTKELIDQQYIEDVILEFKKLMEQKTESPTLEKKWQHFLGKHNWVFCYLFSHPVILVENEAYVGGKNLSNRNGKVTDFLVKNAITDNVAFLEIKTHKTRLIGSKKAYRGNDVFSMSTDLTGGITQVLDQRDNFQKEFFIHKGKSSEKFETINSKCVVLMGSIADLPPEELKSFELFRSNSKDVEIIAFDELLCRLENLRDLMLTAS